MKILITGINGKIGKILKNNLNAHEIYGIDIKGDFTSEVFNVDLSNTTDLERVFLKIPKIDCIVHLAAESLPESSWESVLERNIIGTKNIYECAKKFSIPKIIFASTNRITEGYENDQEKNYLISVSDPVRPLSFYATSKIFGEAVARMYYESFGVKSICLRIGSLVEDDNPKINPRYKKTWISHRDFIHLIERSFVSQIGFGIYYGVSNNKEKFWDISNAKKELGYEPKDNASI